jgi:benzoyl-CoA reductase/2-hydroxyglutaryl-CoA dehydratase subunit BcrC/BadD/HgdB
VSQGKPAGGQNKGSRLTAPILKRVLRSPLGLNLLKGFWGFNSLHEHIRIAGDFALDLARRTYVNPDAPVVWFNGLFPPELVWGLGVIPFYPEIVSAMAASVGLSPSSLARASDAHYPLDICTFHRNAAGLALEGLFPDAEAYVSTSNVCDIAAQMIASQAFQAGREFFLVDVPPSYDEESITHVERQLEELVQRLADLTGIAFDEERLRGAIRFSNEARQFYQQVRSLRRAEPAPLRGSSQLNQLALIATAFGTPDAVEYYRALRDHTGDLVERGATEQQNQRYRLYWMHLKPYFPTDLMSWLEDELGVVIVFEEASNVWWEPMDETRPLRAIAHRILSVYYNGPIERRLETTLRCVEEFRAQGVVQFHHWGCRQSTGALRVLRDALRKEGIPFLQMDGDCIDETNLQMGPLRTRVQGFLEILDKEPRTG